MYKGPEVGAVLMLEGRQGCSCKSKSEKETVEKNGARELAKEDTAWRIIFEFNRRH